MKRVLSGVLTLAIIALVCLVNIGPIIWGVLGSFQYESDLLSYPPRLIGVETTLENYRTVIGNEFLVGARNSLLYGFASVFVVVVVGGAAAYGFDRFEFRGRRALFLGVIASIPLASGAAALIVPNYLYFTWIGWTNHWFTLPVIYAVYSLPMAIWIIRGSFEGLPRELDEAARIDGASSLTILLRILVPLCKPALGAAALFTFIHAWNEFVVGSVMVENPALKPVQVLVYQYIGYFGRDWGPLTAAATLALIPVILLYGFFGRLLVGGLTQGAVKH